MSDNNHVEIECPRCEGLGLVAHYGTLKYCPRCNGNGNIELGPVIENGEIVEDEPQHWWQMSVNGLWFESEREIGDCMANEDGFLDMRFGEPPEPRY